MTDLRNPGVPVIGLIGRTAMTAV